MSEDLNPQQHERDSSTRRIDPDNDPPHSRLFIVCGRGTTEEELEPECRAFGTVQYCRIVRDKTSAEPKGIAYVKYDKASSAALAIEGLNGKKLLHDQPALKVMVADAKGSHSSKGPQSREPEDTPPRSRLFVICSKEFTEEELAEKFRLYGDIEYCKLIRDKNSHESKGYAYVKYFKASHAAVAVEEVSSTVPEGVKLKALIADPKGKNKSGGDMSSMGYPPMPMPVSYPYPDIGTMPGYSMPPYALPRQRLFIVCHKTVTQDQLARLFSRYPGMEYCDLKKDKQTGESKGFAYINYSTPQAAMMAKDQMDGFEFPPGAVFKVMFAEPLGVKGGGSGGAAPESTSISGVTEIRDSFAQMMSYPPAMPMGYPPATHIQPPMSPSTEAKASSDRNYPEGSRLFIVLTKPVPDYILQDVFSRFGALEYVHLQKDKNYGYAKYTTSASAQYAMQYLNNTDIQGQKIKIQIANPPNDSRKRQRV
jgi:RNA recognition motif-containing protein